jgi:hypothetical protein
MNNPLAIGTIWEFSTVQFTVKCEALPDDDLDLSFDDDGSVTDALQRGTLEAFAVHVSCTHNATGVSGDDHLGGCIYKDIYEFRQPGYFFDMVRSAIAECRKNIATVKAVQVKS